MSESVEACLIYIKLAHKTHFIFSIELIIHHWQDNETHTMSHKPRYKALLKVYEGVIEVLHTRPIIYLEKSFCRGF